MTFQYFFSVDSVSLLDIDLSPYANKYYTGWAI